MAHDRDSILQQYPKEVSHILEATTADAKDEAARLRVATTLARALSFTKIRTGEDRTPVDTEVYKLARVIRQARSREQFEALLGEAIPKAKSGILEKYNLAWKLPWLPEKETGQKKTRARRARKAEVSEAPDYSPRSGPEVRARRARKAEVSEAPDLDGRMSALEKAVNRIENQLSDLQAKIESPKVRKLAGQLDEVLQKLKAHRHDPEDGRACILEKKEL